jgi:hypothetical protein
VNPRDQGGANQRPVRRFWPESLVCDESPGREAKRRRVAHDPISDNASEAFRLPKRALGHEAVGRPYAVLSIDRTSGYISRFAVVSSRLAADETMGLWSEADGPGREI